MDALTSITIATAAIRATLAAVAAAGKLARRLEDRTVDRLYYLSYACTGVSAALFVGRGLFRGWPS